MSDGRAVQHPRAADSTHPPWHATALPGQLLAGPEGPLLRAKDNRGCQQAARASQARSARQGAEASGIESLPPGRARRRRRLDAQHQSPTRPPGWGTPRALFEAADDIQARNLRRRLAHAPRQRHQATRPDCHRSAMSTSTCLGTTRSRCRRLPRAANFGHGEPKVNRDPADTYCRAAVDSRHRTSPFGCPDRANDHRPPTLRRRSPIRTACLALPHQKCYSC